VDQDRQEFIELWSQLDERRQAEMLVMLADAIEGDIPPEVAEMVERARRKVAEAKQS
jgi:hypothetical protein